MVAGKPNCGPQHMLREAGEEIRTPDVQLGKLETHPVSAAESRVSGGDTASPSSSSSSSTANWPLDDDLRRLIDAWPTLPEPMRAGILAMVEAAAKDNAR